MPILHPSGAASQVFKAPLWGPNLNHIGVLNMPSQAVVPRLAASNYASRLWLLVTWLLCCLEPCNMVAAVVQMTRERGLTPSNATSSDATGAPAPLMGSRLVSDQ